MEAEWSEAKVGVMLNGFTGKFVGKFSIVFFFSNYLEFFLLFLTNKLKNEKHTKNFAA